MRFLWTLETTGGAHDFYFAHTQMFLDLKNIWWSARNIQWSSIFSTPGPNFVWELKKFSFVFQMQRKVPNRVTFSISMLFRSVLDRQWHIPKLGKTVEHASIEVDIKSMEETVDTKHTSSEEALLETLLKHYKELNVCGIPMTWLIFLKLYRMSLVWCSTYVTEPFPGLRAMTSLVLTVLLLTALVKPYKDNTNNKVALLPYLTSTCIAIINVAKSVLVFGVYQPSVSVLSVLSYMDIVDNILLSGLPLLALCLWIFFLVWKLVRGKKSAWSQVAFLCPFQNG